MDKISYALGLTLAGNLQSSGVKSINANDLADALNDVFNENRLKMTIEESQELLSRYFEELQSKKFESLISEGKSFLEKNSKRAEVSTTESGLQYEVITKGNGAIPKAADKVKVHYHGTLIDGTVFDSSVKRGEPATFGVTQVISGWVEALQLMTVGSKWKLFIPYNLAYGAQGAGQMIKPYSTLIFEVELLDIV